MAESVVVDRWIYGKLFNDATLMTLVTGVYSSPVPPGKLLPYVVLQEQTTRDIRGVGPSRIGIGGTWLVRAVMETPSWGGSLETIANRIDVLLQAASGSATGGVVWACVRERPFRLVESTQNGQYRHLGGIYQIWAT